MKEKLKAMYQSGAIDMNGLLKAVERGWVTMEDVIEIVGEDNSLAIIKAAKIAEISKSCNAIIVAGIDLELTQGAVHFNLSIEDQANQRALPVGIRNRVASLNRRNNGDLP